MSQGVTECNVSSKRALAGWTEHRCVCVVHEPIADVPSDE